MKKLITIINNNIMILVLRIIPDNYVPPRYTNIQQGDIDSNGNYVIENTLEILVTQNTFELIKKFQITSIHQLKNFNRKNEK